MKILILITTYNRPDSLLKLLKELNEDVFSKAVHLLIFDDASTEDYSQVKDYLTKNFMFDYFRNEKNGGRENYWQLVNAAFNEVRNHQFDYFMMIPDDVSIVDNFIFRAMQQWDSIKDNQKACLNLLNDYSRLNTTCWTAIKPKLVYYNGKPVYQTGWIDMCFLATKSFFEIIDYSVYQVERIYQQNKKLSSGVGAQLSREVINARRTIYQVAKSLLIHGLHESKMHPQERVKTPLITNHETVTATMAAIPSRIDALKQVVASIINQVDSLEIYLNNLTYTPEFLTHPKIKYYHSAEEIGDLGDAGKFYRAHEIKGYHLTIDDDLIYPKDYVKKCVEAVEMYGRKSLISFHGRKFIKKPAVSYYRSAEIKIGCLYSQPKDERIDVPGTGVMAYHTDTIQFAIKDFEASNMADIWAAKKAKALNVPIMAIKHKFGWIKHAEINKADTIYANCNGNDGFQTEVLNSFI